MLLSLKKEYIYGEYFVIIYSSIDKVFKLKILWIFFILIKFIYIFQIFVFGQYVLLRSEYNVLKSLLLSK